MDKYKRTLRRKSGLARLARGFSMIELLVAVLIMGVGVLGVTGLQLVSLQNNRDALLRSEAIQLAYDILDRVRINPGVGVPGAGYAGVGFGDAPAAPTDCYQANCTAAQITAFDIAVWQCSLGAFNEDAACVDLRQDVILPPATGAAAQPGLPEGQGEIVIDGNGVLTISIRYRDFAGDLQTVSIESQG
ncbi:MAG: type IV pilus modification protein PilV [Pseudomonadota bacterium]